LIKAKLSQIAVDKVIGFIQAQENIPKRDPASIAGVSVYPTESSIVRFEFYCTAEVFYC